MNELKASAMHDRNMTSRLEELVQENEQIATLIEDIASNQVMWSNNPPERNPPWEQRIALLQRRMRRNELEIMALSQETPSTLRV